MDMIQCSPLPADGILSELPATPGWGIFGAQKRTSGEAVTPVHNGRDWIAFDSVHWDTVLPRSYLAREIEGQYEIENQYEIEDPRPALIKMIPSPRRL